MFKCPRKCCMADEIEIVRMDLDNNFEYGNEPKAIVIHETDNENPTAGAVSHFRFFNNPENEVSVHYVCDEVSILKLLDHSLVAWHCGNSLGTYSNRNTIGIEICVNGDYEEARENAIKLCKYLIGITGIRTIIRHYDVSGKHCPRRMMDLPELWTDFVNRCFEDYIIVEPEIGETEDGYIMGIVNTDVLNVRSGRGILFERIGQVEDGTAVKLLYLMDGWWSIDFEDDLGFVSAEYIDVCR